jgi:biotin transporter BioY
MISVTGSAESGSWDGGVCKAASVGALYCGGGTGFAVYCGIVWLHAAVKMTQGNNAMLLFNLYIGPSCVNVLMVCLLYIEYRSPTMMFMQ